MISRWFSTAVVAGVIGANAGLAWSAPRQGSAADDRAAIERLHQLDVTTTLTDKADELAKLWDRDAVRLEAGSPAEVGKATIYGDDKRWEAKNTGRTLSYKPDVKDVQISGDWAFEWGYFEVTFKESPNAKPTTLHGKQLRVLKRQSDGSWKFARVLSVVDPEHPAKPDPATQPQ